MGAKSREKGMRGELAVVDLLRQFGFKARRAAQLQSSARFAKTTQATPDVIVEGSPFWLEVKRGKRVNWRAAFAQAAADCPKGEIPTVVHRDDRGDWMVTARLEDVLELAAEILQRAEVTR